MTTLSENQSRAQTWKSLQAHIKEIRSVHLQELFNRDSERTQKFSLSFDEIVIDFSKNHITGETMQLLVSLVEACGTEKKIKDLISGKTINPTEKRPALHTALRTPPDSPVSPDVPNIGTLIHTELDRMEEFVKQLHQGDIKGASGKTIDTIINIGIGGSDLGPRLAVEALDEYRNSEFEIRFVANLDVRDIQHALAHSDPETTLFVLASKSFTTSETLTNAKTAKDWLRQRGCQDISQHFVGVTGNEEAAKKYGLSEDRIFQIWDWVGGRYSVWSAVGLPLAIAVGMNRFREFLAGAHAIDTHFHNTKADKNIPVILALLGIWYNNFFHAETQAIVPYDQRLRLLPEYLSQLVMESNGKGVDANGESLDCHTSPVVWGSIGSNAQHAFFQLLHQSERLIPVDFLVPLRTSLNEEHHKKLFANCVAQSKALMSGQANETEPHRHFPGNRPSTTIMYKDLTPRTLGMLLAIYEHKTFVEATIWNINPFDQWGVELGKKLAVEIVGLLGKDDSVSNEEDSSTRFLIEQFRRNN